MFGGNTLVAILGLTALMAEVRGHMVIHSPVPFDKVNLNNSPLDNSGSNFPCKFGPIEVEGGTSSAVYGAKISTMNRMKVGEPQTLSFMGGATHGGGSCQVSLTTDTTPTKKSQWKVIHSIIGGCPSNATGNLSGDADGLNAAVYSYAIPRGVPAGRYTLAWTWFNNLGNREMYMNCAPITVTGGSSRLKRANAMPEAWKKLPTMFVANIPNEQCAISTDQDFDFPPAFKQGAPAETGKSANPGSKFDATAGCASMTKMGAGAGRAALPAAPTDAPAAPSSAQVVPTQPAAPLGTGNQGAASAAIPTPSPPYPTAVAPAPAAGSGSLSTDSGAGSGSGSCPTGKVPCSGTIICVGSKQFAICDRGCALPQDLALGTSCSDAGVISKRGIPQPEYQGTKKGTQSAWRKLVFW